jgi:hypothetical protein
MGNDTVLPPIRIGSELVRQVKEKLGVEGLTLSELVRGLLRAWLHGKAKPMFGEEFFRGKIDKVEVVNRALGSEELAQRYEEAEK